MNEANLVKYIVKHRSSLMAYAWSIVRDEHQAEDILQNVSLNAFKKLDQIRDETHMAGWLRTSLRYEALSAVRKSQRAPSAVEPTLLEAIDDAWEEHGTIEQREVSQQLARCLERLTPRAKQLIHLRYTEGLSGELLARRVQRSVNSVYVGLSRAHRALGDCMAMAGSQ